LVQQILQSTPVIHSALNLRHKFFRHVDGNTTPMQARLHPRRLIKAIVQIRFVSPAISKAGQLYNYNNGQFYSPRSVFAAVNPTQTGGRRD
jgi:hypothetical protein